nr:uncharacterized protein [Tanacetum cinerariifolium]
MFRFEPLFEVGQCYILSNSGIAENSGRHPLLPHRYKISFYKCTTVTRIEPFNNNTNGFILEPFNHLFDPEHHQYYENDVGGIPVYVCEEHGTVQPASRFKVIVRVIDKSGSAPLLFFNNNFVKLSGHTAWELIEKYNMDPDEYWPKELDNIDAPVTIKCCRLEKNGAIMKKNYVQVVSFNIKKDEKHPRGTNQTTYQRIKKPSLIVISDDDDDELDEPKPKKHQPLLKKGRIAHNNDVHMNFLDNKKVLPITDKNAYGKEIQKIENLEFWESIDLNEDFVNLFDEEANEDAETKPETHTESTNDFARLDDLADETTEDLYDSDMFNVKSVSNGDEEDTDMDYLKGKRVTRQSLRRMNSTHPQRKDGKMSPHMELLEFQKHVETLRRATDALDQSYSICCSRGKVKLGTELKEPPQLLKDLITNEHHKSAAFIDNIRRYNSMFAFTFMGRKVDDMVNYGREFRMAGERIKSSNDQRLKLRLIGKRNRDGRQYNLTTASEVAALIVDIFHYGVTNYDEKIKGVRVTMKEWFSYRVQERENEFSMVLNERRLFYKFLVNGYTMIKAERMSFNHKQQKELRSETYSKLAKLAEDLE